MDILVIKKKSYSLIPKHIASIFRTHNIFENKGIHASPTKDAYYKTNGHAGYYINLYEGSTLIDRRDITLTLPTFRYPRNLFKHLAEEYTKLLIIRFPGRIIFLKKCMPRRFLLSTNFPRKIRCFCIA